MRQQSDIPYRFVSPKGRLERVISCEGWIRPAAVMLERGHLKYDFRPPYRRLKPSEGMLEDFLDLRTAGDEAIRRYAQRWGALFASCTGLTNHPKAPDYKPLVDFYSLYDEMETVEQWRIMSKQ